MSEFPPITGKKILILANNDIGLYKFRKALLAELLRCGNTIYVSLPFGEFVQDLKNMGCIFLETPVDRRGMNPFRDICLYHRYRQICREVQPDLVISYTIKPNIYGGLACTVEKIPYVANITGLGSSANKRGLLRNMVLGMYKCSLRRAKIVFFENEGNREDLVRAGVVRRERTYVLNGAGVNTEEYPLQPYIAAKPLRFLFVGRIMKEKGVEELFSAMERLRETYGEHVVLDVVGMFEEAFEQQIRKLEEKGTVVFHGYQSDVRPYYAKAHCVVLPSYHEGMSNVLLEAASSGRALITSDIFGCREAVEDGISGFLCPVNDVDALYCKMQQFVELDDHSRATMGSAGRRHMESCFEKNKVVEMTICNLV